MKIISPSEKKLYLPATGITYGFNPNHITPNLALPETNSENMQEAVIDYIEQQSGQITHSGFPRGRTSADSPFINVTKFIDIKERDQAIGFSDLYTDTFLSRLIPRASELYLLTDTWYPSSHDSRKEIDDLLNNYLVENHGTTYKEFVAKAMSEVKSYKSYAKRPQYEAKTDMRLDMDVIVGSLASLNRDIGLNKDDFFYELSKYQIFPINSKERSGDMLSFLQKQLA